MQECTFAPKTNKARSRASSQAPVLVRGLDAHMSKYERAKKMDAEEAARRAKVFLEEPKTPRAKFTIAKPFNISDNNPVRACCAIRLCSPSAVCLPRSGVVAWGGPPNTTPCQKARLVHC
jgi:hypothetical protein